MSALLPSEVLAKAADLIEPEGAWTQEAFARDEAGQPIEDLDLETFEPACFCVFGALNVAAGRVADAEHYPDRPDPADRYLRLAIGLNDEAPLRLVSAWNDNPERTQPEVVAALRAASELAKAEGQ